MPASGPAEPDSRDSEPPESGRRDSEAAGSDRRDSEAPGPTGTTPSRPAIEDLPFPWQLGGPPIDHLIYVHGLWMNGADGLVLRRRVARDFGMKTHAFHYRSVTGCMSDGAARLRDYARRLGAERLHFVGHSLGGLVIYRMLEQCADLPPGRVVFLGTPAVASRAAAGVRQRLGPAARVVGRCVAEELFTDHSRCWQFSDRQLGVVAGTHRMGMGGLFARLDGDNDGTVAVCETRLPGASDFVSLPVSHMGLLMSARVARETGTFLQTGHFSLHA